MGPLRAPLRSVIYGRSTREDPLIPMVLSLLSQVLNFLTSSPSSIFLRNLILVDISHDIIIPSYFDDPQILVHIAFVLYPQLGGQALEKIALDYMEEEEEDADLEVLDAPPAIFLTPGRREQ